MPVRLLVGTALLLCAAAVHGQSWLSDWDSAFKTAKEEQKAVFVDYYADWCHPCRKMHETVMVDPEVISQLSGFILLRVDADRGMTARVHGVRGLPSYVVYDALQNERFRLTGFRAASQFVAELKTINGGVPLMLAAAKLFETHQDAAAWMSVGRAYSRVRAGADARDAFARARKAALSSGASDVAERADIESAFTWAIQGKHGKSDPLLAKFAASAAVPENRALAWLFLGGSQEIAHDRARAAESYAHVVEFVTADHPLAQEAATAAARVK